LVSIALNIPCSGPGPADDPGSGCGSGSGNNPGMVPGSWSPNFGTATGYCQSNPFNSRYTRTGSGSIRLLGSSRGSGSVFVFGSGITFGFGHGLGFGFGCGYKAGYRCFLYEYHKVYTNLTIFNHTSLIRRMDAEYDDLLRVCNDSPAGEDEPDEHLLDVEDDEEILILEPPLVPTQADTPSTADANLAALTAEKVNELVKEFDKDDMGVSHMSEESHCTANTKGTNFTYSKYGIRENTADITLKYDPERPQMSSAYYQCKMARAASMCIDSTSVDFDNSGGNTKQVQFNSISSLDCIGDTEVLRTFRGTRMSSNNITVNQNISMNYDPATLKCIVCESGHNILNTGQGDAPPTLVFFDQNFVPTLSGKQSCISITRLEDCSLTELTDLA
jgi:hypothetical protein